MTMYKLPKYWDEILRFSSVNTELEIKTLDNIFKKNQVKTILDVACGTGRHSVPLAKLGYKVTGLDYSSYQIKKAKDNARKEKVSPQFLVKDANKFISQKKFDAAICMWSTIGEEPLKYQKVIKNVCQSLKVEGIFVIDNKNWKSARKDTGVKNSSYQERGLSLKRKLWDRYTENFRVRQVVFEINGKKYEELWVTHLLNTKAWIAELKRAGFKAFEIFHDYKKRRLKSPKRILVVAKK